MTPGSADAAAGPPLPEAALETIIRPAEKSRVAPPSSITIRHVRDRPLNDALVEGAVDA